MHMMMQKLVLLASVIFAICSTSATGQTFPTGPIRLVAPEPGGGADLVARIVAQGLTERLGQQALVDNRGGSAIIPAEIVAKAPPDGQVLLFCASAHWLLPLFQEVSYDPIRDYAPITLTTTSPAVIAVNPSLNVSSVKELIALAKSRPGQLNVASGTKGSTTYLSAELFKAEAGVDIVGIPYKGAAPALTAVVAKQVDMIVITASSVMPYAKSGKLKVLAVASPRPSVLAPGVPTTSEAGMPGFESGTVHALFAPGRTPERIVMRLNQEVTQYLKQPEIREKLLGLGLDVVASSPAQLTATVKSETERIEKMLKKIGS